MNNEAVAKIRRRTTTINFRASLGAGLSACYVSNRLGQPFLTKLVRAKFALNQNGLLHLYFFVSTTSNTPATLPEDGTNLLRAHGDIDYIAGDDEIKELSIEVPVTHRGGYIKLFAVNNDVNALTVDAQVMLELEYIESPAGTEDKRPKVVGQVEPYEAEDTAPTVTPAPRRPEIPVTPETREPLAREKKHGLTLPIQGREHA